MMLNQGVAQIPLRLKIRFCKECRFDSDRPHHKKILVLNRPVNRSGYRRATPNVGPTGELRVEPQRAFSALGIVQRRMFAEGDPAVRNVCSFLERIFIGFSAPAMA